MFQPGRNPDISGVIAALEKLANVVPPTPLLPLEWGESRLWCKCESDQPVGAFKLRGAWHRLTDLSAAERAAGVVAFSSGNHAQGVAWAAKQLGVDAVIVMPSDAPKLKVEGTRALGATICFYNRQTESREDIAAQIAAERGCVLIPSFDDPWIIEGQGTAGLEALAQLGAEPDLVVTPCGGGGLAAGLALALPRSRIVVVEPEGWDDMGESLRGGHIVPVAPNPPATSCDALQTQRVSPLTFAILQKRGAVAVSVTEDQTATAMRYAFQRLKRVIEPGGAVGLAALLAGIIAPGQRTLVMLSGGNVDPDLFSAMTSG
jgi:threonine dehydratase